jgi:hypothetical protein
MKPSTAWQSWHGVLVAPWSPSRPDSRGGRALPDPKICEVRLLFAAPRASGADEAGAEAEAGTGAEKGTQSARETEGSVDKQEGSEGGRVAQGSAHSAHTSTYRDRSVQAAAEGPLSGRSGGPRPVWTDGPRQRLLSGSAEGGTAEWNCRGRDC